MRYLRNFKGYALFLLGTKCPISTLPANRGKYQKTRSA